MRKTSHDGGDSTSITSGFENEVKKSVAGIVKTKRNSIKRKVQNFSHESDDGVAEPLLQKEKDKPDSSNQGAKYLLSKTKTDLPIKRSDDKDKLLPESKPEKSSFSGLSGISENLVNGTKEEGSYVRVTTTIHNHMNTNIFGGSDAIKNETTPKTQMLVEIDGNKCGFSASPLIFTTAKIHTNGKTKQMEPVQVTPVPILSTVEGRIIKSDSVGDDGKTKTGTAQKSTINNSILHTSQTEGTKVLGNTKKDPGTPSTHAISTVVSANVEDTHYDKKAQNISKQITTPNLIHTLGTDSKNFVPGAELKPTMTIKSNVANIPKISQSTNVPSSEELNPRVSKVFNADVNKNFETSFNPSTSISLKSAPITVIKENAVKTEDEIENKNLQSQKIAIDEGVSKLKPSKINEKSLLSSTSKANITTVGSSSSTIPTDKNISMSISTVQSSGSSLLPVKPVALNVTIAQSKTSPGLITKPSSASMDKPQNTQLVNKSLHGTVISPNISSISKSIVTNISEQSKSPVATASEITGVTLTNIPGTVKSAVALSKPSTVSTSNLPPTNMNLKNPASAVKLATKTSASVKNKQPVSKVETNLPAISGTSLVSDENTCTVKLADSTVKLPETTSTILKSVVDSKVTTAGIPTVTKGVMSHVLSYSNISKTTSSSSNLVTSTAKTAIANKSKLPQSTLTSQTTIGIVKPSSSTSKSPSSSVKQSVGLSTTKASQTSAKTNTTASSNKAAISSKTPTISTSTRKSSVLHNQIQSQSSDHKKDNIK